MKIIDQDIYGLIPVELWVRIIDSSYKTEHIIGLLFSCKQFFGLIKVLYSVIDIADLAIKYNKLDVLKYILELKSFNSEFYSSGKLGVVNINLWLKKACQYGRISILKFLIECGANYRVDCDKPVVLAAENGHLDIVEFLSTKKVNIRTQHNYPLEVACKQGHVEIVKFLAANKCNYWSRRSRALVNACRFGHLEIVKFLVENGANINSNSSNLKPVYAAIIGGHVNVLDFLLTNKAVIEYIQAAITAAYYNRLTIIKYLYNQNREINFTFALQEASCRGYTNIVEFLLSNYLDNIDTNHIKFILKTVVTKRQNEVVKIYIDNSFYPE
ncbi:ankyrin repeat-containing protein [Acanthamoeba polyphaga mimivirus]|uniref:Ankyrin repeat-containing protein n=1 Tax=Acanthamoeba polyphaga mimivirus Kroon TaxID=3069720 RepID=A0A0G2Y7N6_9VIRU|nr:ankyrin repeat-containing protein [Acanthamoeba polyphaga mimivirus]AKI79832.1 ankyrin repeat-containing protein [Acanthamoeba polyphaga mimivirus Kroon]